MLFLLTNRTRPDLNAAQYADLASLAKTFYASIPANVTIRGEWAAIDKSHNVTLLEAPDIDTVLQIQAPFERLHRNRDRAGDGDIGVECGLMAVLPAIRS